MPCHRDTASLLLPRRATIRSMPSRSPMPLFLTMFYVHQRGSRMSLDSPSRRPVAIDRASSTAMVSRTSWGEESHIRVGPEASGGQLTILDYRAPAGFGPQRPLHQRDDEVIELVEGQVGVW